MNVGNTVNTTEDLRACARNISKKLGLDESHFLECGLSRNEKTIDSASNDSLKYAILLLLESYHKDLSLDTIKEALRCLDGRYLMWALSSCHFLPEEIFDENMERLEYRYAFQTLSDLDFDENPWLSKHLSVFTEHDLYRFFRSNGDISSEVLAKYLCKLSYEHRLEILKYRLGK